ncbi:MAG: hypothetical protein ABJA76_10240, partial [Mucilaginibacter sp.]
MCGENVVDKKRIPPSCSIQYKRKNPAGLLSKALRGGNRYVTALYRQTSLRRGYFFVRQWPKTC